MPLQNRVDPFGAIHSAAARGLFCGNRGILHDPETRALLKRRWSTKAWIVCECSFGDRRRDVMGRNGRQGGAGWTELFFLDEVTALAAGHRPCFYCRRVSASAFAQSFAQGQGKHHISAPEMDLQLHAQRRASGGKAIDLLPAQLADLPDGTMVEEAGRAFALRGGRLMAWDFAGYGEPFSPDVFHGPVTMITPPSAVTALRHGYSPAWHPSAGP